METHTRAQAITLGLKRYFTGKACKLGHVAARHMVGGCIECRRVYERERRRKRRQANPSESTKERRGRKVRKRASLISGLSTLQRGRCAYCREKLTPATTHVDHIQPRSKGGPNTRRNYQLACADCNITKRDKDPILFAQEIGRLL